MRYRYLLGVKWSQVQILSAHRLSRAEPNARSEAVVRVCTTRSIGLAGEPVREVSAAWRPGARGEGFGMVGPGLLRLIGPARLRGQVALTMSGVSMTHVDVLIVTALEE